MSKHDDVDDRPPPESLEGDRGKVAGRNSKPRLFLILIMALIGLLIVGWYVNRFFPTKLKEEKKEEIVPSLPAAQGEKPTAELRVNIPPDPPQKKEPIEIVPAIPARKYEEKEPPKPLPPPPDPWAAARRPHLTQRQRGGKDSTSLSSVDQATYPNAVIALPGVKSANEQFADRMKPAPTEGVMAKKIMIPSLMVTKGTIAQCNLQTAINTEVAGLIVCTLARDVRSTDGNVKLMKKGSLMVGEYQNGLEIGDKRIFVLWTRYEDKQTHVTMEIASPGADELGRAGLGGEINTKFWERFGAAIMFSLVGDIPSFLNKSGNGSSTTVNVINSTTTTGAEIIKNVISLTKNVRPSLEKNQGGMVSIVFARDLDFSSTYRLKKEGDR